MKILSNWQTLLINISVLVLITLVIFKTGNELAMLALALLQPVQNDAVPLGDTSEESGHGIGFNAEID